MKRIVIVEKDKVFDLVELEKIAENLAKKNYNIMVFGLPNSGKSTLIKAILKKNNCFCTLEEEEVIDKEHIAQLIRETGKKWAVSHQYPTMDENATDEYLQRFLAESIGMNPKKWIIIRIKTK